MALELDIRSSGISLSELEYTMMLEALSRCGAGSQCDVAMPISRIRACSAPDSNEDAFALLRRMKDDLRLVSSELFGAIKQWFVARCPDWTIESSTIDDDGACVADSSIRLMAVRSPFVAALRWQHPGLTNATRWT